MTTSLLSAQRASTATDSRQTTTYSLELESAETLWLLLTFTNWAFLQVEVQHGFVLTPTSVALTSKDALLTPSELRWLVVDVLRSRLAAHTLLSKQIGALTRANAGAPPRTATIEALDHRVRRFLNVLAPADVAQQYMSAVPAATLEETTERLRAGLLTCAAVSRPD